MVFALLMLACFSSEPDPVESLATGERSMTLVYTGSVHGEIEPCG
jgi:hypothetical protein